MIPSSALRKVLSSPTVEALWELRADLLERGTPTDSRLLQIIGDFHAFLDQLTAPLRDIDAPTDGKAVLAGRLFQVLLLAHISDDVPPRPSPSEDKLGRGHS